MHRHAVPVLLSALIVALGCQSAAGAAIRSAGSVGAGQDESAQTRAFDPGSTRFRFERVLGGLRQPTMVTAAYDGSGRLFVTERAGRILIVENGQLRADPFLDISPIIRSREQEQGLLSVAFHPRYQENGRFFVYYTNTQGSIALARYGVSSDPNRADPDSGVLLLTIPKPAANHNGGLLVFGPDGYLYAGTGDGGGAGDQFRNAQNRGSLLGKLLRLDVDRGDTYEIPPENPFVNSPGALPEIFAYGLRNPWRFSFDWLTRELYIADVGQNRFEWVHHQNTGTVGGQNYGWPIREGFHCFPSGDTCSTEGLETPIGEYGRDKGCSVTGGFVYRGQAYPHAQGGYFFADFCSGRVWSLDWSPSRGWRQTELANTGLSISSFGEDESGELYAVTLDPGGLLRVTLD